jgi:hypothetical protein
MMTLSTLLQRGHPFTLSLGSNGFGARSTSDSRPRQPHSQNTLSFSIAGMGPHLKVENAGAQPKRPSKMDLVLVIGQDEHHFGFRARS